MTSADRDAEGESCQNHTSACVPASRQAKPPIGWPVRWPSCRATDDCTMRRGTPLTSNVSRWHWPRGSDTTRGAPIQNAHTRRGQPKGLDDRVGDFGMMWAYLGSVGCKVSIRWRLCALKRRFYLTDAACRNHEVQGRHLRSLCHWQKRLG